MWIYKRDELESSRGYRLTIHQDSQTLTFVDVISEWQRNAEFREFYISLLTALPFDAIFWETPAVTADTISNKYEFVAVESQVLSSVRSNLQPFERNFQSVDPEESVVAFENLGRDAMLVVPCPTGQQAAYAHLMAFLREGPQQQKHELFKQLGRAVEDRLSSQPLWINTSGLGVYWLHVRLDSRPKYYTYAPYKNFS